MPTLQGKDLGLLPTMGVGSYASPSWLLAARRVLRAGDAGPADMEEAIQDAIKMAIMFYLTLHFPGNTVSGATGSLLPVPSCRTGEQVASGTPIPERKTPPFPFCKGGVEFNMIPY